MNPAIFLSAVGAGFLLFIVGVIWLAPAPWQGGMFVTVGGLFLIAGVAAVAWGFANDGHEAYDAMVSGFFGVVMIGVAVVFALLAWWRW